MGYNLDVFQIFGGKEFSEMAAGFERNLRERVSTESPEYILNVNETGYLEHLVSSFRVEPLTFHYEDLEISEREVGNPPEHRITFHLPFSGTKNLLHCRPNPRIMFHPQVYIDDGSVCFDIVNASGNAKVVAQRKDEILNAIQENCESLAKNVVTFNSRLQSLIKNLFTERRGEIMEQQNLVAELGLPIKRRSDVPQTVAIPSIRKKIVPKPSASSNAYAPEPTIAQDDYEEILRTIHEMGKVFERHPSTYADKNEETLRDHLILCLEPQFEGSTTGETFNKSGKTDILIRHENKNVFVAECKFWSGPKGHQKTIDQILSYLTWRDSKTAIVCFVGTREINPVLEAIEKTTPEHSCYLKSKGKKEESWFSFEFHLPGDPSRRLQLAILCFHTPKSRIRHI